MSYDAGNRKDVKRAEKLAAFAEHNRIQFLRAAMTTVEGRAWFYNFLAGCHIFSSAPTFDTARDYFTLGERNKGLQIFADITLYCPDTYLRMMQEAQETTNVRREPIPDSNHSGPTAQQPRGEVGGWDAFDESVDDAGDAAS